MTKLLNQDKVLGLRQVIRGVMSGKIRCVILADNADKDIKRRLTELCGSRSVPIVFTADMAELGREAGLDVGCAAIGLLKP